MKKLIALAVAAAASGAFASELDLQAGQTSFSVQATDLRIYSDSYIYGNTAASSETVFKYNYFSANVSAEHALSDAIKVGGYVYIRSSKDITETKNSVASTTTSTKGSYFTLNPTVAYEFSPGLSAVGTLLFTSSPAEVDTDNAGNETFANLDYLKTGVRAGLGYKKDLRSNVLLDASGYVGTYKNAYTDPEVSSNKEEYSYFEMGATAGVRYFLADNFSVDGSLSLYRNSQTKEVVDGTEIDLGDNYDDDTAFDIAAGFTYYLR